MDSSARIEMISTIGGLFRQARIAAFLASASSKYSGLRLVKLFTPTDFVPENFENIRCNLKPTKGFAIKNIAAKKKRK